MRRLAKRCTVVREVKHAWQTRAHEVAADIRFRNRGDKRPCIGRNRLDTCFTAGPWVPKGDDEA